MRAPLAFLAQRRWAGVGLALVAEILLLVVLAVAPPSSIVGIPAAVTAAIAGTIAVVFGILDGVIVATAGALIFAALGGWEAGEIASIAVWPAIVAAVGLFARRIERHRIALRELVDAQEDERHSLALTLHDDSAQRLVGALLTLRAAAPIASATAETDRARAMITETIQQLRRLALELSPKALEDHGLAAALEHLADSESLESGTSVQFAGDWDGRLAPEAERALFRFAQAAVRTALEQGADEIAVTLADEGARIAVAVSAHVARAESMVLPPSLDERLRFLQGKLTSHRREDGTIVFRADVPAQKRPIDGAGNAA